MTGSRIRRPGWIRRKDIVGREGRRRVIDNLFHVHQIGVQGQHQGGLEHAPMFEIPPVEPMGVETRA